MIGQEIPVNNDILKWARDEANLSLEEAASRAGIKELKREGLEASDRLAIWESGDEKPTLRQLEQIAKAYRRPLLTFFLSKPPRSETILKDYRTIGDRPIEKSSPEFNALRRQIEALQKEIRRLVEKEGNKPIELIGSPIHIDNPSEFARLIHTKLSFTFENQQSVLDSDHLFSVIRERLDAIGIFVIRQGDLGSYHSKIIVEEFRGLAISDPYAPFIVINPNDTPPALVFSLVHELAHLWLGESSISNYNTFEVEKNVYQTAANHLARYQQRERFCNGVAAEFLVPRSNLLEAWRNEYGETDDIIKAISLKFKVSRIVIARRLLEFDKITSDDYWDLYKQWKYERRERQKEEEGGPGYYIRIKSKFGIKLLHTVIESAKKGKISYNEASRLLNVKVDHFDKLYLE
jgi:Zn-dependent peptidase ImmA (M78 family)/transcriptional regulator with XRE-family HTH domain